MHGFNSVTYDVRQLSWAKSHGQISLYLSHMAWRHGVTIFDLMDCADTILVMQLSIMCASLQY